MDNSYYFSPQNLNAEEEETSFLDSEKTLFPRFQRRKSLIAF